MKKKYTQEEKFNISKEATVLRKGKIYPLNAKEIALKYGVHISTIYSWIDRYQRKIGRSVMIGVRFSIEEKENLENLCKELGYENDVSYFIRRLIFANTIVTGNPSKIIDELYSTRAELNKIGSNLNQIANYTNFLQSKNYLDNDYEKDFIGYGQKLNKSLYDMRDVLDKTIRNIYM